MRRALIMRVLKSQRLRALSRRVLRDQTGRFLERCITAALEFGISFQTTGTEAARSRRGGSLPSPMFV